jgi:hypothetical protein
MAYNYRGLCNNKFKLYYKKSLHSTFEKLAFNIIAKLKNDMFWGDFGAFMAAWQIGNTIMKRMTRDLSRIYCFLRILKGSLTFIA